ncbi:MAG: glycosyltransferase family 4 protein [Candidatus Glassbacteria bacterium]
MKAFFFTEGTRSSPASRIRVYEYLDRYGNESGLTYAAASFTSDTYTRAIVAGRISGSIWKIAEKIYQFAAILRLTLGAATADVLFIQRVLLPVWLQKITGVLNRKIVYDFDDAVYLGPEREKRFREMCRSAVLVLAVSRAAAVEALARGASPEKVAVLPTPVDVSAFAGRNSRRQEIFTVGWIGSPATTKFLAGLLPQLTRFAGSCPEARYLFIGSSRFDTGELAGRVEFLDWSPENQAAGLARLDVGVMPLPDDPWCRGKGGYKLIQYMAAGAACLAGPVGANLEIVVEGETGFFAREDSEWAVHLSRLAADRELCRRLGEAGRERAQRLYDYRALGPEFFRLLERAGG